MTPPPRTSAGEDEPAEATLVGRAQDGDVEAFEMLVRRYQSPLFRLAHQMLRDRGAAEDAVQDSMVQVWRRLPSLSDAGAFRGWIYQLTTRRCLDLLRRSSRRRTDATDTEHLERVVDPSADPAEQVVRSAQVAGLQERLQELPLEQRTCWILRELHDLDYSEIAAIVQLPVSTVRGRLARARENLTKGMQPWR